MKPKLCKVCLVKPVLCRGWCSTHYYRWLSHGSADYEPRPKNSYEVIGNTAKFSLYRYDGSVKGHFYVDVGDIDRVLKYRWASNSSDYIQSGRDNIKLHRYIVDAPCNMLVDHKDGNPLNNRRDNLRICTHADNARNTRPNNGKVFKGVNVVKKTGRYIARLQHNGRKHNLGTYSTPEEAAEAYNRKALEVFGEFARLNKLQMVPVALEMID